MLIKSCLLLLFFLQLNPTYLAFVCTPQHCVSVKCEQLEEEDCKGPDKTIKPGGFCSCCNLCYTILGKGDECPMLESVVLGLPPPTKQCGEGLICIKGKCAEYADLVSDYS